MAIKRESACPECDKFSFVNGLCLSKVIFVERWHLENEREIPKTYEIEALFHGQ